MATISIVVKAENGETKAALSRTNQAVLVWEGVYEEGDAITFGTDEKNAHYVVRVDDAMDEALVFFAEHQVVYKLPFGEKKVSYNPKIFTGNRHYLTMRKAEAYEIASYRNLARNCMDQHGDPGCYPHAYANVETRGEAVFAARNAIDGVVSNLSHGEWPYQSWGINRQDDAQMTLDFGRPVDFDKVVLYTRADFPHDNWWVEATFTFSDGSVQVVKMEKSENPHVFSIEKKNITWLRLSNLVKADDPSPFPALTQIEVYGSDSRP